MWHLSGFDPARVHKGNVGLASTWKVMNGTERLAMFVLIVVAPGFLQPLLRWVFQRPTRRVGFWLALLLVTAGLLVGRLVG